MEYKVELNSVSAFPAWSGGKDTLNEVVERGAEDRLTELLEMIFDSSVPSDTEVNDFLWFERDYIYRELGFLDLMDDE